MAPPLPPTQEGPLERAASSNQSSASIAIVRPSCNSSLASVGQSSTLSTPSPTQRKSLSKRNVSDKLYGPFEKFEGGNEPRVIECDSNSKLTNKKSNSIRGTNTLGNTSSHSHASVSSRDAASLSSCLLETPDVSPRKQASNCGHASSNIGSGVKPPLPPSMQQETLEATKERSSAAKKIFDRVMKFDANPLDGILLSPMQMHASAPFISIGGLPLATSDVDNGEVPLSPMHALTSVPTRKRSVRHKKIEIKARVFDSATSQKNAESKRVLLSPQEVRELVKSSKTNARLDKLLYRYEHLSEEESKERRRLAAKISARERRRRLGTNPANSEARRLAWEQSRARCREKAAFGYSITDSSLPLCLSGTNGEERSDSCNKAVYDEVRAISYDFSDFKPTSFPKTETQRKLILEVVERDFLFAEFRENGKARTEGSLNGLIDAFEPICLPASHVLLHQGEEEGNDKFYILEGGTIDLQMDGVSVGRLESVGESFGQLALMYHAPSNVTISVGLSSKGQGSNEGVKLLKLDQKTYRGLLHEYSRRTHTEKHRTLLRVDFLHDLVEGDEILRNRLSSAMVRHEFDLGHTFDATEDTTFFMILFGEMNAKSEDGAFNEMLSAGSYFGEKTLLGSLPRRGTSTSEVRIVAQSEGVLFTIDKESIERILGRGRLQNLRDMHKLAATSLVKTAVRKLTRDLRDKMANKITEWKLKGDEKVDKSEKAALYVVREGSLVVHYKDVESGKECKNEVKAGDVFGHEQVKAIVVNGGTKFQRIGGLTTSIPSGLTASIGIFPLDEAELDDTPASESTLASLVTNTATPESAQVINSNSMTPKRLVLESPTIQLRKKLRNAVQNNLTLDQLIKIRLLGEGEFGEVWMVAADVFHSGVPELRQFFALKSQCHKDITRGKDAKADILREIQVLKEVEHPQVVDIVNTYEDKESIHILMGLIPGGELWDLIHKEDKEGKWQSGMSEENAQFVTKVVADTLAFIHSKNIVFRDLKPENIMIDADGYPVLVDFGFAKFCSDKTYTFVGTPNYVAPEIITSAGHNRCVDFWALGVTVYEMMTGENPFFCDGMDQVYLYHAICNEKYYPLPEESSASLVDFVDGLLEKNPTQRLGMLSGGGDDVLDHPWFGALDADKIRSKQWPAPWKASTSDDSESEDYVLQRLGMKILPPFLDDSIETGNVGDSASSIVDKSERENSMGSIQVEVSVPETDSETKMKADKKKKKGKKKSSGACNQKKNISDPASEYLYVTPTQVSYYSIKAPTKSLARKAKEKEESNNRRSVLKGSLRSMGIDSDEEDFERFLAER